MKKLLIVTMALLVTMVLFSCGGDYNGPKLGGTTTSPVIDTTPPTVLSTSPTNSATNVGTTATISVTFSEQIDPFTVIAGSTFTLTAGGVPVAGTISAFGYATVIFTYSGSLAVGTTYTATVTTGVTDLSGNPLAANHTWTFTTSAAADTTPPTVTAVTPLNGATNVAVNTTISAVFSEAIDCATVTTGSFTATDGTTAVVGTITSCAGSTAVFTPSSSLAYSTAYTATITTGVTDLAGNALVAPYVWTFTTVAVPDATPPTVSSTTPANGDINVAVNTTITAVFSEAIDCATVTTGSFTATDGTTAVVGTITSCAGSTAVFTPSSDLANGTAYTATITTGVTDLAGNPLAADYIWSFTTAAAPDTIPPTVSSTTPANGDINVAVNTTITAVFSEAIDCATVTIGSFTATDGTTPVVGTITSCAGSTAVFTPSSNLASTTLYTVTITTGVTDLAGNPMAADYIWSFTTI